ncbi:MAG: hypothetical protein Q4P14_05605, partial [Methanobacteriaceae archaeon]|nr:hypothetical protein [Methanobacteriaceae archaeon]
KMLNIKYNIYLEEKDDLPIYRVVFMKFNFFKSLFIKRLICAIMVIMLFTLLSCGKTNDLKKFDYNLSIDELRMRTSEEYLATKKFLDVDSKEYLNLADGDKEALAHLVKVSKILEKIEYQIDNVHNLDILAWLDEEEKNGSEKAKLTKELFVAQQGPNAKDTMYNNIKLIKNVDQKLGMGVYPEDLTVDEFHNILIKMLEENKINEVKNILNQRSIVARDGKELKGIDYVDYFKEDFKNAAYELIEASKVSTDKDFNEYLELQAKALLTANPILDAEADIKWATLQYTPLEFTLVRENYYDNMTPTVSENSKLKALLNEKGITVVSKDNIGCRVGIVNNEGTEFLTKIKKYMPTLAANMPYNDEYEQDFSDTSEIKQSMVDADLVTLTGYIGAYRNVIPTAENLPNDDKLSLTMGGGRRNIYHRQIRFSHSQKEYQDKIDAILDKEQHKYFYPEAYHWFVLGHENVHSLGPKVDGSELGKYRNIIEENKADMGSFSFLDLLTDLGMYDEEQKKQIIVTTLVGYFVKTKPDFTIAHRVRQVMQIKYLHDRGAFDITTDGKIHVNFDKVIPASKSMLEEIIRIQIEQDYNKAEKYVNDNFVWTDYMEMIGQKLQKTDKILNGKIEAKLAESLIK